MSHEFYVTPEEYEVAALNGIKSSVVNSRIRNLGWRKAEALSKPVRVRDENLARWASVAVDNNIKKRTFYARVAKGWTHKDAATIAALSPAECLARAYAKRKRLFTDAELKHAKALNLTSNHLHDRVRECGWSKEKALNTPLMTRKEVRSLATKSSPFRNMNDIHFNAQKDERGNYGGREQI